MFRIGQTVQILSADEQRKNGKHVARLTTYSGRNIVVTGTRERADGKIIISIDKYATNYDDWFLECRFKAVCDTEEFE